MALSFDHIQTPAITKAQLSKLLYEPLGLNKREAKDFINEYLDLITQQVAQAQDVKI